MSAEGRKSDCCDTVARGKDIYNNYGGSNATSIMLRNIYYREEQKCRDLTSLQIQSPQQFATWRATVYRAIYPVRVELTLRSDPVWAGKNQIKKVSTRRVIQRRLLPLMLKSTLCSVLLPFKLFPCRIKFTH